MPLWAQSSSLLDFVNCVHAVYGYVHATAAEVSCTGQNNYSLGLYRNGLPVFDLDSNSGEGPRA